MARPSVTTATAVKPGVCAIAERRTEDCSSIVRLNEDVDLSDEKDLSGRTCRSNHDVSGAGAQDQRFAAAIDCPLQSFATGAFCDHRELARYTALTRFRVDIHARIRRTAISIRPADVPI